MEGRHAAMPGAASADACRPLLRTWLSHALLLLKLDARPGGARALGAGDALLKLTDRAGTFLASGCRSGLTGAAAGRGET